jgi:hypothetical protein
LLLKLRAMKLWFAKRMYECPRCQGDSGDADCLLPGIHHRRGIGEVGGMVAAIILLMLTPSGSNAFWLTLVALLGLVAMQGIFWLFTQPANRFWLRNQNLHGFSSGFFSVGPKSEIEAGAHPMDLEPLAQSLGIPRTWPVRDFALVSLIAIAAATASNR